MFPEELFTISIILLMGCIIQVFIGKPIEGCHKRIKDFLREHNNVRYLEMQREISISFWGRYFNEKAHLFRNLIGLLEIFFFLILTFLLFQFHNEGEVKIIENLKIQTQVFAGWIAIKMFGNYQRWSNPIFGRAYFYIFLLGTLLNFILSSLCGYLIYSLSISIFNDLTNYFVNHFTYLLFFVFSLPPLYLFLIFTRIRIWIKNQSWKTK